MKTTLLAALLAMTTLGGCVAVPYYAEPAPVGYYYGPNYPPLSVELGYTYHRSGPRHHYHDYRHR